MFFRRKRLYFPDREEDFEDEEDSQSDEESEKMRSSSSSSDSDLPQPKKRKYKQTSDSSSDDEEFQRNNRESRRQASINNRRLQAPRSSSKDNDGIPINSSYPLKQVVQLKMEDKLTSDARWPPEHLIREPYIPPPKPVLPPFRISDLDASYKISRKSSINNRRRRKYSSSSDDSSDDDTPRNRLSMPKLPIKLEMEPESSSSHSLSIDNLRPSPQKQKIGNCSSSIKSVDVKPEKLLIRRFAPPPKPSVVEVPRRVVNQVIRQGARLREGPVYVSANFDRPFVRTGKPMSAPLALRPVPPSRPFIRIEPIPRNQIGQPQPMIRMIPTSDSRSRSFYLRKFDVQPPAKSHPKVANELCNEDSSSDDGTYDIKRNAQSVVTNVFRYNRRTGYKPRSDTNWCHLPLEMRLRCIKDMDFVTRLKLRSTSSVERNLCDSNKYKIGTLFVSSHVSIGSHWNFKETEFPSKCSPHQMALLINLCLKLAKFDTLWIGTDESMDPEDFKHPIRIQCRNLKIRTTQSWMVQFLLKNCEEGVEKIEMNALENVPICEIVNLPVVIRAKDVFIENLKCTCFLYQLMRNWMEASVPVGTTLTVVTTVKGGTLASFRREFRGKIAGSSTGVLLISTNRSDMNILVKRKTSRDEETITCEMVEKTGSN